MILRAFLVVLVALCLAPFARAQSDLPAPTYTSNGGSFSNPPIAGLGAARSFVNTAGGGVTVRDSVSALLAGRSVAMQLGRDLSKSQVAAVAGRCLLNPLCVGTAAAAAVAANLVANRCAINGGAFACDFGVTPSQISGTVYRVKPTASHVGVDHPTAAAACDAWRSYMNSQTPAVQYTVTGSTETSSSYTCYMNQVTYSCSQGGTYPNCTNGAFYTSTKNDPYGTGDKLAGTYAGCPNGGQVGTDGLCPSGVYTPPTEAQATGMVDALPAGSVDGSAVVPAAVGAGAPVAGTTPGTLTGPASIPGTTTTTTGANGTTTSTTTNNVTYQGNSYTYVTNTTTVNPDGTTTTSEETPNEIAPPANPALGAIPTLYERAYPDGLAGVWETRRAQLGQTPIFSFVYSLVPQTGDGGCPSWSLPGGQLLGITVGGDLSVPCYVWSFIRLVLVCSALLLARALIFGG